MNHDNGKHSLAWLESVGLRPRPGSVGLAQRHPWHVATASGKLFDLVDPKPADISIEDIAHALSQINRFTGHTSEPYSVAQHSIACADECAQRYTGRWDLQLACLLHDAAEAYCGDVSRPLKQLIAPCYRPIEARLQAAVWNRFGIVIDAETEAVIHECDDAAVMAEARDLMIGSAAWNWGDTVPRKATAVGWHQREAKRTFLNCFHALYAAHFGKPWAA